ncbi:MAG TPA: hypothetical protein VGF22_22745, partial [Acidimicrobiales bacterium]
WDLLAGVTTATLEGHVDRVVRGLAVSADGSRAVSASDDLRVKVWDLDTGELVATFTADVEVVSTAIDATGRGIVVGDRLGQLHRLRLVLPDDE